MKQSDLIAVARVLNRAGLRFRYVPAEDENTDPEVELLTDKGLPTGVAVQLCEDGQYTANKLEDGDNGFTMTFEPNRTSITEATEDAVRLAQGAGGQ